MNDPYSVLGVSRGATDEEIRIAYRQLAKQYAESESAISSDRKMKALDEAYDAIIYERTASGAGSNQQYQYAESQQNTYNTFNDFGDIRAKINSNRIEDADTLLDGVPVSARNAEWYYLKGTVHHRRGWLEEATKAFGKACELDPTNREYADAYNRISSANSGGYRTSKGSAKSNECGFCDACTGLLCADCCCECFGGDLIPCC